MQLSQILLPLLSGAAVYLAVTVHSASTPLLDPVAPASAELSGTRLKARYIRGADGSRTFLPDVFYDSQLDVDCKFSNASDDKLRCLPESPPFQYSIFYLDDQCTKPATEAFGPQPGCPAKPPPKWFLAFYNQGYCEVVTKAHFFPFEGNLFGNVNVYGEHLGTCSGIGQTNVFTLKPEASATTFVEGTPGIDP